MIPYNGEEVKLVWANMDQYYIKSSELLRDYVFASAWRPGERTSRTVARRQAEEAVIRFKFVEGDTEKDNRKPTENRPRLRAR